MDYKGTLMIDVPNLPDSINRFSRDPAWRRMRTSLSVTDSA